LKKSFVNQQIMLTCALMIICVYVFVTAGGFRGTSGLLPRLVSCVTFFLCVIQLGFQIRESLNAKKNQSTQAEKSANRKNFWVTVIGLIVYPVLIFTVGFFPATFIYMLGSMLLYGYKRIVVACLVSAGMTLFIYLVFTVTLRLQPPTGLFY